MIRFLVLAAVASVCLAAPPVNTPPADCPQMLKDAEQAILDCDVKIQNATDNMNTTSAQLDRDVSQKAAFKTQASNNLNVAVNKDNLDRSKLANHQADLQNAQNNLKNIEANCGSAAPPPNCAQLIADAKDKIAALNNQIDQDITQIQMDDAVVAYNQQLLKQAGDAYDASVANRTTWIKKLQDAITNATNDKAAALQHLQEVQQECQMEVTIIFAKDCPEELKQAQEAVAAAGDAINAATAAYNAQMPALDNAVTAAMNLINARTMQLNTDINRANADKQTLANDQARLSDARNALANIQTTCAGPAPPIDCQQQIAAAQQKVVDATNKVAQDTSVVAQDEQRIAQDQSAVTDAKAQYDQAVANRDAQRKYLQANIDTANANYQTAETHYEEVQQRCGITTRHVRSADDCQTELANAQKAISAAGVQLNARTDEYNQEVPQLDAAVNAAQNVINQCQAQLNADTNRANADQTTLKNHLSNLANALNDLTNQKTTCAAPNPPPNCDSLIAAAQAKVDNAKAVVAADEQTVDADKQVIAQDNVASANAKNAYAAAVANRDSTRQQLQQAIDDATATYNAAEKHYEDVQQQCHQQVVIA